MAGRHFLQIPGPTNVPDRILRAMDRPVIDHRGPEFPALVREVTDGLKQIFQTAEGAIVLHPASGTGAWEASIVNTLNAGDRVLAFNIGHFSHLYAECARRFGIVVDEADLPWGEGVPADLVYDRLKGDEARRYRAVLVVHNETSTGVTSNVKAVREAMTAAGHPALLLADVVSALGSVEPAKSSEACLRGRVSRSPGLSRWRSRTTSWRAHLPDTQSRARLTTGVQMCYARHACRRGDPPRAPLTA